MTAFPERLDQLERRLEASRFDDGGWPNALNMTGSASTIVSTSQVLGILRVLGRPLISPLVQHGLAYLSRAVFEHPRPTGRGEFSRYPAYALWGLMQYRTGQYNVDLRRASHEAFVLLKDFELRRGGWGNRRGSADISFPITMVAIDALYRYRPFLPTRAVADATSVIERACQAVAWRVEGRKGARWWAQFRGGTPCPGATACAVLSLVNGGPEQQALAREGIAWLAANPDRWTRDVTYDRASQNRPWKIPTFSVGLRAVLHPRGERDLGSTAISEAVHHFDDLWDDQSGAWSDEIGAGASTAGSFGIVMAARALREAFRFDPGVDLVLRANGRRKTPLVSKGDPALLRELRIDQTTRVVALEYLASGETHEETFRDQTGWRALSAVASRHVANEWTMDKTEMSVSLRDLASSTRSSEDTVRRAIARINERFGRFVLLDVHIPGGTKEIRFIIENTRVIITASGPQDEAVADPNGGKR